MITWKQWGRSKFCTWHDHCEHAQHCNSGPNESAERDITKWQQFRPVLTKIGLSEATVTTKETEETNKVPLGLYFLDVLFFFFYINCASVPAKGNTCGRGSIIPPMRPHNLPWYWFATHIPLNKVHINSKRNKETGSNCFKAIVLRI